MSLDPRVGGQMVLSDYDKKTTQAVGGKNSCNSYCRQTTREIGKKKKNFTKKKIQMALKPMK